MIWWETRGVYQGCYGYGSGLGPYAFICRIEEDCDVVD
jgi:hypothetical protein